jgi:hypothetical protein
VRRRSRRASTPPTETISRLVSVSSRLLSGAGSSASPSIAPVLRPLWAARSPGIADAAGGGFERFRENAHGKPKRCSRKRSSGGACSSGEGGAAPVRQDGRRSLSQTSVGSPLGRGRVYLAMLAISTIAVAARTYLLLARSPIVLMLKAFFNASASASLTPASADTGASTRSASELDS